MRLEETTFKQLMDMPKVKFDEVMKESQNISIMLGVSNMLKLEYKGMTEMFNDLSIVVDSHKLTEDKQVEAENTLSGLYALLMKIEYMVLVLEKAIKANQQDI